MNVQGSYTEIQNAVFVLSSQLH